MGTDEKGFHRDWGQGRKSVFGHGVLPLSRNLRVGVQALACPDSLKAGLQLAGPPSQRSFPGTCCPHEFKAARNANREFMAVLHSWGRFMEKGGTARPREKCSKPDWRPPAAVSTFDPLSRSAPLWNLALGIFFEL